MIYILNIGYRSYAFKSMRGLQAVMDALGKALPLKECYWPGCERDNFGRLEVDDRPLRGRPQRGGSRVLESGGGVPVRGFGGEERLTT